MAQIQKLIQENQKLKYQLEKFKGSNGLLSYVDDSLFKGGYRVVKTIDDRNNIDCCHSKQGMIVCVIGEDLSFKEYRLISDCKNKQWEEVQTQVTENDVILTEDYSELSENLTTQKDLNLILKQLILDLQTQIDNVELTDEKVQITEATNFAQIGQTQKDFNKSVSNYKTNSDLKNQEQDNRLSDIEGKNIAQDDLINDLSSELDTEKGRNDAQDSKLVSIEEDLIEKLDKGNYTGTAQDLKNSIDSKLNKPTTTSNTTSYPFVVGENGNGGSARLPAGDLGKNFFNSDLSNTTARNHTMNAGVTINTLGNPHTLSGLPNKNADIANFRKVRVQNASGLDSVVDSKNLLTDGLTSMTDAEKDAWRLASRKSNETYSTGQPRVDYILPFVVKRETFIQYVSLIGLNLFVNPLNTVIKLVNIATLVEYDVANNTISVNANDTGKLQFSLNFSTIPVGVYKIKLIHSNLQNIANTTFEVVDNINSIPINCTWNSLKSTDSRFSHYTAITSTTSVYQKTPVTSGANSQNVITEVIKSSPILTAIQAAGNWVIRLKLTHNKNDSNWGGYKIGISNSNTGINLINDIMYGFYRTVALHAIIPLNTEIGIAPLLNEDITIIKSGLNIKVISSFGGYMLSGISTLSSNFNSDISLSLVMQGSYSGNAFYLDSDINVIIESIILN